MLFSLFLCKGTLMYSKAKSTKLWQGTDHKIKE